MKQTWHLDNNKLYDYSSFLAAISEKVYDLPERTPQNHLSWSAIHDYSAIRDGSNQARASIFESSEYKNDYVIAFKGSNSIMDFFTDAFCIYTPLSTYKNKGSQKASVHTGFRHLYNSNLQRTLFQFIESRKINTLYITGHSLGGALSQLFLYDLLISLNTSIPRIVCVAIASPKVAENYYKLDFESRFDALCDSKRSKKLNYINLTIKADIVPKYPIDPGSAALGHYQIAGQNYSMEDGNSPEDHVIANYRKAIVRRFGK